MRWTALAIAVTLSAGCAGAPVATTVAHPRSAVLRDSSRLARTHPVARECDTRAPRWIFCDDFESDRLGSYFEYTHPHGSFERAGGAGVLGSTAMRVRFDAGTSDAGSLKLAFGRVPTTYMRPVDAGTIVYHEIYWRMYLRTDSTWRGGGGDKLSRAQGLASASWAQAFSAPVWSTGNGSDPDHLAIDPYSGVDGAGHLAATKYNDFTHLRWLGAAHSTTAIFDSAHVGRWYCIEAHVRLNDRGASNGVFELWIDDLLEAQRRDLDWTRGYDAYGINTLFIENYWNAGSPAPQNRYIDNLVVSTARIGCSPE